MRVSVLIGRVLLGLLVVISTFNWFRSPLSMPLDSDEVVWMLDAAAFDWYISGSFTQFNLTNEITDLKWSDHQYRIIDQPQLGKYILGGLLFLRGLKPWLSPQRQELYTAFQTGSLPTGSLTSLNGAIDPEILTAITYIRYVNTFFSWIAFLFVSLLLWKETKQVWSSVVLLLFLTHNQTIHHYYRLAIVNTYSFIAQALAVAIIVMGLRYVYTHFSAHSIKEWRQLLIWGVGAGLLVAMATSIKLDGGFLVVGPYVLFLLWGVFSLIKSKPHLVTLVKRYAIWLSSFIFSGGLTFLILEPELWNQPAVHTSMLIAARLGQQQRFLLHFADLTLLQTLDFWLKALFKLPVLLQLILLGLIGAGKIIIFELVWNVLWKRSFKFQSKPIFFEGIIFIMLISILGGSLFCSQVGFDRYIIPAVITCYVAILLLISRRLAHIANLVSIRYNSWFIR